MILNHKVTRWWWHLLWDFLISDETILHYQTSLPTAEGQSYSMQATIRIQDIVSYSFVKHFKSNKSKCVLPFTWVVQTKQVLMISWHFQTDVWVVIYGAFKTQAGTTATSLIRWLIVVLIPLANEWLVLKYRQNAVNFQLCFINQAKPAALQRCCCVPLRLIHQQKWWMIPVTFELEVWEYNASISSTELCRLKLRLWLPSWLSQMVG